ncbi:MAG: BRO family protein [Flavobacteriaceae bacterium]
MYVNKESEANTTNEPQEVITFNFSESKNPIRNIFVDGEPYFVGSDLTKALAYKNSRKALKDHCRYVTKRYIPHPQSKTKNLQVLVIPESDVYRLIIGSTLPKAQEFERWLMEDVLPSLRKKGYYAMHKPQDDFIDARDVPFYTKVINGYNVRCIDLATTTWVVVNDVNKAIHSSTGSHQLSKKLNAKQVLAKKIWLFGNTHAAWCTNQLGLQLLLAGSRKFNSVNQLNLAL